MRRNENSTENCGTMTSGAAGHESHVNSKEILAWNVAPTRRLRARL